MLREFWQWCRAEASPVARRMGHLSEAIALEARARRQQNQWAEHLNLTRQAILQQANVIHAEGNALIFGSGGLLDIPLAELCARFRRVYLVDIVHLPATRKQVRQFTNAELMEQDVTGLLEALMQRDPDMDETSFERWFRCQPLPVEFPPGVVFAASVNLLSQLPVKPVQWLQNLHPGFSEAVLNRFAWHLMEQHLKLLRSLQVPVCLICDDELATFSESGQCLERIHLLDYLGLNQQVCQRWSWNLAPAGELPDRQQAIHQVAAIRLSH